MEENIVEVVENEEVKTEETAVVPGKESEETMLTSADVNTAGLVGMLLGVIGAIVVPKIVKGVSNAVVKWKVRKEEKKQTERIIETTFEDKMTSDDIED